MMRQDLSVRAFFFFVFFLRQTPVEGKGLKQNRAERH